jgi:hypothetical protein
MPKIQPWGRDPSPYRDLHSGGDTILAPMEQRRNPKGDPGIEGYLNEYAGGNKAIWDFFKSNPDIEAWTRWRRQDPSAVGAPFPPEFEKRMEDFFDSYDNMQTRQASFRTGTESADTPHRNSPYPVVDPDELDGWHQEFPYFSKQEILNALQGRDPGLMAVLNGTYRGGGTTDNPLRTAPTPRWDDYLYGVPEGGTGIPKPPNPATDPFQGAIENTGKVLKMPFEGLGMLTGRTVDAGADILRLLSGPPIWEKLGDGYPPWREDEKPKFADEKVSTTQVLWRDLIRELIHGPRKPEDKD